MPPDGLRVADAMTASVLTIAPDADVTAAVACMVAADVSGLVVVDADGRLAGILTERDCIEAATAADYHGDRAGPVASFMSAPVETVAPHDSLIDVAVRMAHSRYRRFPVVEDGRLVGLLGRRDVMEALHERAGAALPPSEIECIARQRSERGRKSAGEVSEVP